MRTPLRPALGLLRGPSNGAFSGLQRLPMLPVSRNAQAELPVQRTASHRHVGHLSFEQFTALKAAEKKVFRRVLIPCIFLMVVNYLDR